MHLIWVSRIWNLLRVEDSLDVFLIIGVVGADGGWYSKVDWIWVYWVGRTLEDWIKTTDYGGRSVLQPFLAPKRRRKLQGSKVDLGLLESWWEIGPSVGHYPNGRPKRQVKFLKASQPCACACACACSWKVKKETFRLMKRPALFCNESEFGSLVVIINISNPRKEIIFSLQTQRIMYRHI